MATLNSNSFSITVNRDGIATLNTLTSDSFNITVNRRPIISSSLYTSTLQVIKGDVPLIAVDSNPSEGQYSFSITEQTDCEVSKIANDTVSITSITADLAHATLTINAEGANSYTKRLTVIKSKQGSEGTPGIGVEDVIIEYAKNQSTTEAPTSGWSTTMPSYEEGYYLWMRTGIKYSDRDYYVYSDPICDESWRVAQEVYTQYKQLSDKFTWLVKSGDSESTMQLTDRLFELVSKNIILTADRINLNGYVSNDDANWSIDNEGNMQAENLNVEDTLSVDTISCKELNSANYPKTLSGTIDVYVNSSTGNDDNELEDEAIFATLQGVIDKIPKFMNGKTVRIALQNDVTENISLLCFACGTIRIYLDGHTIYGTVRSYGCSSPINIYGGTQADTTGATGKIHPSTGLAFASRSVSMGFESSTYIALYKLIVYAPDNSPSDITDSDKVCVGAQTGTGCVYCSDIKVMNADIGFRSNNAGHIQAASTRGIASKYGFQATTGGTIGLHNDGQAGGNTANTNEGPSGKVLFDAPIFDFGATSADPGLAPTPTATKTLTVKSSYGDTYRSSVYNSWKKDGSARQGDYGYGDCTGLWFFGTAFSELKGKTITKVTITITRNRGGSSSTVGLAVKTHNYSARPSGAPTLGTSCGTLSLTTGSTGTLTITNSTVLNGISAGTVKGFGIRSTYDSAHYAVCSGSVTVKITYTE